MVSGCLGARASHPGWIGLGHLALLLAVSACDGSESRATRSEPWLKDEVALSRTESASLRYRAVHGQRLHFSVRAKQGDLRGSVPLHSAELEFDPRALDGGRGKLTFDLEGLALERASEEEVGAASVSDLLLGEAARLWLSLGPDVARAERAEAAHAQFDVRLGRGLSSHSVQGGAPVPVLDAAGRRAGMARRVSGLVEGDLLLLGREVTHVLEVEVDFEVPRGQRSPGAPERLVVRLSEAEGVPLSEHGIVPRDARGAVVSEQWATFGRSPGLRALVTGSLRFERSRE